jgi:hypothetical protein
MRHHRITEVLSPPYNCATHIWWHIIYDLVETDMITEEMAWNSLFREKMYNIGIVVVFFSSIDSLFFLPCREI